jgi:DNA repair exonuclease SbcCD ATPase subunit
MSLRDMFPGTPVSVVPGKSLNVSSGVESLGVSIYRFNSARMNIDKITTTLATMTGERNKLEFQQVEAQKRQADAKQALIDIDKVILLLQSVSDLARQEAKGYIEDTVSQALNVVHGGDHKFIIKLKTGKNGPEVEYWLDSGTTVTQLKRPDYDRGGGKIDIISIAIRLALIELIGNQGPIMFDEPGHNLSQEVIPGMAYFLKEYSTKFNRQLLLNTHYDPVAEIGDNSIQVTQKAGVSEVKNNV